MKIYNYNKKTKEYTTESVATKNPLEQGKYLIPANATVVAPLEKKLGMAICYDEGNKKWKYIEDNRGSIVHNKKTKEKLTIKELGSIPEGYSVNPIPDTLEEYKEKKISNVKNQCDINIVSGFYSDALGKRHFYNSTKEEQQNLTGVCMAGNDWYFKTAELKNDGTLEERTMKPHNIVQLKKVLADGIKHISNCVIYKDVKTGLIKTASSKKDINNINKDSVIAAAKVLGLTLDLTLESVEFN